MPKLALIYGGASSEHSVSCSTAAGINRVIDKDTYEVIPIGITKSGRFVLEPIPDQVELGDWPEVSEDAPELLMPIGGGELRMAATGISLGKIDIAFPVVHGVNGEDGSLQGLLQLCKVPYVGNGLLASAIAMDKAIAKKAFRDAGIPVAEDLVITKQDWNHEAALLIKEAAKLFGDSVFVKPSRSGSSVGVSKVSKADFKRDSSVLVEAINAAFEHDGTVLIEQEMIGREVECSVLEYSDGSLSVSLPGEIIVHGRDFYDYEAKYLGGSAELLTPCEMDDKDYSRMAELARTAFRAIGCSGMARTDFFLTKKGLYLTEVNTMPGFTPISMYPSLWAATGVDYAKLVATLIEQGLAQGTTPR